MPSLLRRLFFPQAAAQEEAEALLASSPTAESVFALLKKRTQEDAAVRLIAASADAPCKEALARWHAWLEQEWATRQAKRIDQLRREAQAYFTGGQSTASSPRSELRSLPGLGNVTFVDFRSNEERRIEQDAHAGRPLGTAFDGLVAEVMAIGRSAEYTVLPEKMTAAYDTEGRHKRVYEIGRLLDAAGGMKLMQAAAYRVRFAGCDGRDLDRCWDGIGKWRQ